MASGVLIDPACNALWNEFHSAKVKTRRLITFRINDTFNAIIPDGEDWQLPMKTTQGPEALKETQEVIQTLKDLILQERNAGSPIQPRWIIMYFDYLEEPDSRATGKELMIKWCPDGVKVKSRMTFASSSKGLQDALDSFKCLVTQADELEEIDDLLPRLRRGFFK